MQTAGGGQTLHGSHPASSIISTTVDPIALGLVTIIPFNTLREWITISLLQAQHPEAWTKELLQTYQAFPLAVPEGG